MPKFFVDNICDSTIKITGEDYLHINNVLRYKEGGKIIICDGKGTDYICNIKEISKKHILAEITGSKKNNCEPRTGITLFQAIPKMDKMEQIITKAVELGVKRVVPVMTSRSIGTYSGKLEKRLERFNKISESAAKQCGRGIIPEILMPVALSESISDNFDLLLAAYENEREITIKQKLQGFTGLNIGIYIGPEGGFAENEIQLMRQSGVATVTLGTRILRTETAGPTMIAVILHELEG